MKVTRVPHDGRSIMGGKGVLIPFELKPIGTPMPGAKPFLRHVQHPPRASQFLAAHPGNLDPIMLQRFIDDVWADILGRLANPIRVTTSRSGRVVEVLGTHRYKVIKKTGQVHIEILERTLTFCRTTAPVAVDPPMRPTLYWIDSILYQWSEPLAAVMIDHHPTGAAESWFATVRRVFWQAMYRSSYWKRLRYAVRDALALDPKVLGWARHGRARHLNQCVSNHQYNGVLLDRFFYEQIEHDSPKLIWLFTLMRDDYVQLPVGEIVGCMRDYLRGKGLTPAGWRMLSNGTERDFRHIRDWIGPDGLSYGRIKEILPWLRFMGALRRKSPLPNAIRKLFLHDNYDKNTEGQVRLRNVWLDVPVVKIILDEAERRLARGALHSFVREELVEVMTLLESERPNFDKNQIKAGWKRLETRAVQWKIEVEVADLKWCSALATTTIGPWTVVPITDAWTLRHEALRQHHCADRYVGKCLAGDYRIFSVRNGQGQPVATIGIELHGNAWRSFGIRRACNKPVGKSLLGLDEQIASRYTDLWRLTQPIPPAAPASVERGDPVHYSFQEINICPVCGSVGSDCECHTVACYDMFQNTLIGGALDRLFNRIEAEVEGILTQAVASGLRDIGLGRDFNALLDDLRQDVADGSEVKDALRNWGPTLRRSLMDLLLEQPEVQCTIYDFYGGMPGTSTAYKTYWADDPYAAVTRLESRLAAVAEWMATLRTDDEVLRGNETRLGITVDRTDPMLPAVIAMERALQKMCGRGAP